MSKNKHKRFRELATYPHVFQNHDDLQPTLIDHRDEAIDLRGRWHEHFGADRPLWLELACGRGEYTVHVARTRPDVNVVGVDIKGARIHAGATTALQEDLSNAAFVRTRIELIEHFFGPGEVDEIWIIFPDPFPKDRHAKHRLTSPRFLDRYRKILAPGGHIHLKTDSDLLFDYTLEVLADQGIEPDIVERDVRRTGSAQMLVEDVMTHYERMHIEDGRTIDHLRFTLDGRG